MSDQPSPDPVLPHMCRDGHEIVWHRDSTSEMCPLCRALAAKEAAERKAEDVLSSPMAAGLLLQLKVECEKQHARAKQAEQERDEARNLLAQAAQRINCAGPVHHRIDVLRQELTARAEQAEATLQAVSRLVERVNEEAAESDDDGDFCCAETARNIAKELSTLLAERASQKQKRGE